MGNAKSQRIIEQLKFLGTSGTTKVLRNLAAAGSLLFSQPYSENQCRLLAKIVLRLFYMSDRNKNGAFWHEP